MEELLKKAKSGDVEAMYELGVAYQFAKYTDKPDYEEAYRWYLRAAQMNHQEAMIAVGDALSLGRGCKADIASGSMWYQEAYELGKRK